MKRYHTLMILVVASLFLVSGCNKEDSNARVGTFFGGTEGVSVETVLKNKGEFDLQTGKAKARIFGVNLNNFGLTSEYKGTDGSLRARGEFSEQGGEQVIDFGNAR